VLLTIPEIVNAFCSYHLQFPNSG